ncbi:MAG: hypothetical protein LBR06_04315 [Bacteroidales bacterium]|jgi:hypothetical protein|nr:hypothetical protein [Bacteroidales bacterium]
MRKRNNIREIPSVFGYRPEQNCRTKPLTGIGYLLFSESSLSVSRQTVLRSYKHKVSMNKGLSPSSLTKLIYIYGPSLIKFNRKIICGIVFVFLLQLPACEIIPNGESTNLYFKAWRMNTTYLYYLKIHEHILDARSYWSLDGTDSIQGITFGKFGFSVITSDSVYFNSAPYYYSAEPPYNERIPVLEAQLDKSFHTKSDMVRINYLVNGVSNFVITADKTLFGIPAGQSLNRHIIIHQFDPDFIASSISKTLISGFYDKKPVKIDEWLSLKPLGSYDMTFYFDSLPDELPQEVCFTVTLTTDEGEVCSYTSVPLLLKKD